MDCSNYGNFEVCLDFWWVEDKLFTGCTLLDNFETSRGGIPISSCMFTPNLIKIQWAVWALQLSTDRQTRQTDGQTYGRTDGWTRDKTSVTFSKCSQFGTGNTKRENTNRHRAELFKQFLQLLLVLPNQMKLIHLQNPNQLSKYTSTWQDFPLLAVLSFYW